MFGFLVIGLGIVAAIGAAFSKLPDWAKGLSIVAFIAICVGSFLFGIFFEKPGPPSDTYGQHETNRFW